MKDKIKTLDKKCYNLELQKIRKKQQIREKGITLIALVVTIIILLILAGVTLNIALSDNGLLKKAKEGVDKYEKAQKDEEKAIEDIANEMEKITINYNDYVGSYVTGYNPKIKTEEPYIIGAAMSGYESEQNFTTDETMKWRIWDYDESKKIIRLISEKPTGELYLKGSTGYNNCVYVLNEICRQCYGTGENGVDVENIKRSDIEKIIAYDYTEFVNDGNYKYGQKKENGLRSPIMWQKFDQQWEYEKDYDGNVINNTDKEGLIWEEENHSEDLGKDIVKPETQVEYKQSSWVKNLEREDFLNQKYYELLFQDRIANYWLSTRSCDLASGLDEVWFRIPCVFAHNGGHSIGDLGLYSRIHGEQAEKNCSLRPMVSINLEKSGYSLKKASDGNMVVSFDLKKNARG